MRPLRYSAVANIGDKRSAVVVRCIYSSCTSIFARNVSPARSGHRAVLVRLT